MGVACGSHYLGEFLRVRTYVQDSVAVAMSSGSKQEQLRRLMREQKAKSSADQKRIEHPLAR